MLRDFHHDFFAVDRMCFEHVIDRRHGIAGQKTDVNDRALRNIVIGLGTRADGTPRQSGFDITAASEVMAVLGPPTAGRALDRLRAQGRLKPASLEWPLPAPVQTRRSASEALAELRTGER